jgi:hypothetical protein
MTRNLRSALVATALSLIYLGFCGNVFAQKAKSKSKKPRSAPTGATPAITETNKMIAEAEKRYTELLSQYVTKCEDGTYYMVQVGAIYQLEKFQIKVAVSSPEFLSRIDKLNGEELSGSAKIVAVGWYKEYDSFIQDMFAYGRQRATWSKYLPANNVALLSLSFAKNNGKYTNSSLSGNFKPNCNFIKSFTKDEYVPDAYNLIIRPKRDQEISDTFRQCGNRFYHAFSSSTLIEIEDVRTAIDPPEWHGKEPGLNHWEGTFQFYGGNYKIYEGSGTLAHSGTFKGNQFLSYSFEMAGYSIKTGAWRWAFPNSRTQQKYNLASGAAPTCDIAARFINGENVSLPSR